MAVHVVPVAGTLVTVLLTSVLKFASFSSDSAHVFSTEPLSSSSVKHFSSDSYMDAMHWLSGLPSVYGSCHFNCYRSITFSACLNDSISSSLSGVCIVMTTSPMVQSFYKEYTLPTCPTWNSPKREGQRQATFPG